MNNLNVFLLDDEKNMHYIIKKYFDDIYTVYSAYSYKEAEELLKSKPKGFFKIFIIDIILNGGNRSGIDFIKAHLDTCKTIVLSGHMDKRIMEILIEIGIFAAFGKPLNFEELFISMNSIIRCEDD